MNRFLAALLGLLLMAAPALAQNTVTVNVVDADLVDVFALIGAQAHMNLIADASVPHVKVTLRFIDVPARMVLNALESAYNLGEVSRDGYSKILSSAAMGASGEGYTTESVAVYGVNAQNLVGQLLSAVPAGTVLVASPKGNAIVVSGTPYAVRRAKGIISGITAERSVGPLRSIALKYLVPSELVTLLQNAGEIDAPTVVSADDARGFLYVRASEKTFARIKDSVALVDRPASQVTYAVQVLDVTPENDSLNVGVIWGGQDQSGKYTQGGTFTAFAVNALPLNAKINALVAKGTASILARPKVAVINGQTGKLLVGSQYPIAITNSGLVGGSQVQFVQIGVQFSVTPTIGSDGSILTNLTTTFSEVTGIEPVSQYPIIGTRTVSSVLRVRDGESIVLAGLFSDIRSQTISKIPVLGDIPIVGGVFKNRQRSAVKDEIVFVLTPQLGLQAATGDRHDVTR